MQKENFYISGLSESTHIFNNYHFCRGNSNRRKSRFGVIAKGRGTYIYMDKKLSVKEGDVVFIPGNVYCYSEWRGNPEIEVMYVNCFIHGAQFQYEPQTIACDEEIKIDLIEIAQLLQNDDAKILEAYSLFYKVLTKMFPRMIRLTVSYSKTLQIAIEFITENWNVDFQMSDLAKKCCVSESTLYHLFQHELGRTPIEFRNFIRINMAIEYLEQSEYSVSTISHFVGFQSENHFRKIFADITKTTPLKYRKNQEIN